MSFVLQSWRKQTRNDKTYNRFHDGTRNNPDIIRLRELQKVMDRAVLEEYGWGDIPTRYEFLAGRAIGGRVFGESTLSLPMPDDVRYEVLGRLIELNAQRARDERASGESAVAEFGDPNEAQAIREIEEQPGKSLGVVPPTLFAEPEE